MLHPTVRAAMKCARARCSRLARTQGWCEPHYGLAVRGYVDSRPVRAHLERLRAAGYSWRQIADLAGLSDAAFHAMGDRVQARTEAAVLALPVPKLADGTRFIPATGSIRRVQALAAMGWPQTVIAHRAGMDQRHLSHMLRQTYVTARRAKTIRAVFDELHMTVGPSRRTRLVARKWGYVTSLAWDDIDNPLETPTTGVHSKASWLENYEELRQLGVPESRIPERMGISRNGFDQQIRRLGITKGKAA